MASATPLVDKTLVGHLGRQYQRGVNRDLSSGKADGVFARQLLSVIRTWLQQLAQTPEASDSRETLNAFIATALRHNRSSCALSNFPDEHNPQGLYLAETLAAVEGYWSAFELRLTARTPHSHSRTTGGTL